MTLLKHRVLDKFNYICFFLNKKSKSYFINTLITKNIAITNTCNNFFWFYKSLCSFKFPMQNVTLSKFLVNIVSFYVKKHKNYLKFSLLNIEKISNFQWSNIYIKAALLNISDSSLISKNKVTLFFFLVAELLSMALFNFSAIKCNTVSVNKSPYIVDKASQKSYLLYKNNYKSFSIKKKNNYKQCNNVELSYFKIKLFRLKKFKGVATSLNFKTNQEPTPNNILLNKFLINFLKKKNVNVYFAHIRNKNFILYDLFSRIFYDSKHMQSHLLSIMSKVQLYEKFFFYKKKEVFLLKQNELLILNNKRNNYVDWKTSQFNMCHLIFFNKVRLTYKKKISHLGGSYIFLNSDFLNLFKNKDISFCYLPNNIKIKKLFYNKKFKKFIYFRRIRHFIQYLQSIDAGLNNNYVYQIWKKASELKNLIYLWLKFRVKSVKHFYGKNKLLPVVNTYDNGILKYFNAFNSKHCYIPKHIRFTDMYAFMPNFLINSLKKNAVCLLRSKLLRIKKNNRFERWYPNDEMCKFFLIGNKSYTDIVKCSLLTKLKLFITTVAYNNFSSSLSFVNPLLLELYVDEDPYYCFIPESITIFHIFINKWAIKYWYHSTPTALFRNILICRQNLKLSSMLKTPVRVLSYYKAKVSSFFSKWEPCNIVLNNNFFTYVAKNKNSVYFDYSSLSVDIIFLDGFSRNFFKNYNIGVLANIILKKKYYLYVECSVYPKNSPNLALFVVNEILVNLQRLSPLKFTKLRKIILQAKLNKIKLSVTSKKSKSARLLSKQKPVFLKKLKFIKSKLIQARMHLVVNRLTAYKILKKNVKGFPITFNDVSYFYKKKIIRKQLMFNLCLGINPSMYALRLKKKQQHLKFLNFKFSNVGMSAFVKNLFSNVLLNNTLTLKLFSFNKSLSAFKVKKFLTSLYLSAVMLFKRNVSNKKFNPVLKKFKALLLFLYISLFKNYCKTLKINIKKIFSLFSIIIKKSAKICFKIKSSVPPLTNFRNSTDLLQLSNLIHLRTLSKCILKKKSKLFHALTKKKVNFKVLSFFFNNSRVMNNYSFITSKLFKNKLVSLKNKSFDVYSKFSNISKTLKNSNASRFFKNVNLKKKIQKKFKKLSKTINFQNNAPTYTVFNEPLIANLLCSRVIDVPFNDKNKVVHTSLFLLIRHASSISLFSLTNYSIFYYIFSTPSNKICLLGTNSFVFKLHNGLVNSQLRKLPNWVLSFFYLIKPGFLNYITKLSSFLNSLFFFIKKQRLSNFFNKFWVDRGFFFPIELSLFKFFFLYYTNFFFNFFEISSFLNINNFYKKSQIEKKASSYKSLFVSNVASTPRTARLSQFVKKKTPSSNLGLKHNNVNKTYFVSALINFFKQAVKQHVILQVNNVSVQPSQFFNFLSITKKTWHRRFFRKTRIMLKNFNFSSLTNLTNSLNNSKHLVLIPFFIRKKNLKKKNINFFNITHNCAILKFFNFYKTFNFFKSYLSCTTSLVTWKKKRISVNSIFLFKAAYVRNSLKKKLFRQSRFLIAPNLIFFKFLRLRKKSLFFKKRLWKSFKKKNIIFFKNKQTNQKRNFFKKTLSFFNTKSLYKSRSLLGKGSTNFFSNNHFKNDSHAIFDYSKLLSKQHSPKFAMQNFFLKNKIINCYSPAGFVENYFFKPSAIKSNNKASTANYVIKKKNIIFKIKPGYTVLWRQYRQEYKLITNLSYYRQRRLTNYFLNFKKSNGVAFLKNFEFSVFSVLRRSTVFLDYTLSNVCFSLGMVFLNGQKSFNKLFQVYVGDRLQVILNYNYLLQFKWFFFFVNLRKIRFLTKYVKYFFNVNNSSLMLRKRLLQFSEKLFKKLLYLGNDIPNYLEVDFMTMLVVVIYDPFLFCEFDPILIFRVPFLSLRLYNWKYIN